MTPEEERIETLLGALQAAEGALASVLDHHPNPGIRAIYQHIVEVLTKEKECP